MSATPQIKPTEYPARIYLRERTVGPHHTGVLHSDWERTPERGQVEYVRADIASTKVATLAAKLSAVVAKWRKRSENMPRGGYHEAQAANKAEQDTLDGCADDIDAALKEAKP